MFVCPGANRPEGWPYPPAKFCAAAGRCDCGGLWCAVHGCQVSEDHPAPVKAAT